MAEEASRSTDSISTVKSGCIARRNSLPLFRSDLGKDVPRYLRASTGSCHDHCKHGRREVDEVTPKKPVIKRPIAPKGLTASDKPQLGQNDPTKIRKPQILPGNKTAEASSKQSTVRDKDTITKSVKPKLLKEKSMTRNSAATSGNEKLQRKREIVPGSGNIGDANTNSKSNEGRNLTKSENGSSTNAAMKLKAKAKPSPSPAPIRVVVRVKPLSSSSPQRVRPVIKARPQSSPTKLRPVGLRVKSSLSPTKSRHMGLRVNSLSSPMKSRNVGLRVNSSSSPIKLKPASLKVNSSSSPGSLKLKHATSKTSARSISPRTVPSKKSIAIRNQTVKMGKSSKVRATETVATCSVSPDFKDAAKSESKELQQEDLVEGQIDERKELQQEDLVEGQTDEMNELQQEDLVEGQTDEMKELQQEDLVEAQTDEMKELQQEDLVETLIDEMEELQQEDPVEAQSDEMEELLQEDPVEDQIDEREELEQEDPVEAQSDEMEELQQEDPVEADIDERKELQKENRVEAQTDEKKELQQEDLVESQTDERRELQEDPVEAQIDEMKELQQEDLLETQIDERKDLQQEDPVEAQIDESKELQQESQVEDQVDESKELQQENQVEDQIDEKKEEVFEFEHNEEDLSHETEIQIKEEVSESYDDKASEKTLYVIETENGNDIQPAPNAEDGIPNVQSLDLVSPPQSPNSAICGNESNMTMEPEASILEFSNTDTDTALPCADHETPEIEPLPSLSPEIPPEFQSNVVASNESYQYEVSVDGSIYTDSEYGYSSYEDEPLVEVENPNGDADNVKVKKKSLIVTSQENGKDPVKLSFRRGRVIDIADENHGPRRLKFRRARVLDEKAVNDLIRRRSFKVSNATQADITTENNPGSVVLRHQDMQDKKDSQILLNNVIEETASKLVEKRKSMVKALVGAFETVISLQDGKPATTQEDQ